MAQWVFYVLPTKILDKEVGGQVTISLSRLKKLKPSIVEYGKIRGAIEHRLGVNL